MKKSRMVNVRLDEETYQRLKSLAERSGASLSDTIRRHLTPPQTFTFGPVTSSAWLTVGPNTTTTWNSRWAA